MSMYEWAADPTTNSKQARKQRARNKRLERTITELLVVLKTSSATSPTSNPGMCIRCGRDYSGEPELEGIELSKRRLPWISRATTLRPREGRCAMSTAGIIIGAKPRPPIAHAHALTSQRSAAVAQ